MEIDMLQASVNYDTLFAKSGASNVTIRCHVDGTYSVSFFWGETLKGEEKANRLTKAKSIAKSWLTGSDEIEWFRIGQYGHVYKDGD